MGGGYIKAVGDYVKAGEDKNDARSGPGTGCDRERPIRLTAAAASTVRYPSRADDRWLRLPSATGRATLPLQPTGLRPATAHGSVPKAALVAHRRPRRPHRELASEVELGRGGRPTGDRAAPQPQLLVVVVLDAGRRACLRGDLGGVTGWLLTPPVPEGAAQVALRRQRRLTMPGRPIALSS
jgi:hypothetical protein